MRRLVLLRHAPTEATRRSAFPADEDLDDAGREACVALPAARGEVLCAPERRAVQTCVAAGYADARVVDALADCDYGRWSGRTVGEVFSEEPEDAASWRLDPFAAPHGGEPLDAFLARIGGWLDEQATLDGPCLAVTDAGAVRAAVVHALGAPTEAFWRLDVAPLRRTELHARDGRWTVREVNA